jgi:hypothetical protein
MGSKYVITAFKPRRTPTNAIQTDASAFLTDGDLVFFDEICEYLDCKSSP